MKVGMLVALSPIAALVLLVATLLPGVGLHARWRRADESRAGDEQRDHHAYEHHADEGCRGGH